MKAVILKDADGPQTGSTAYNLKQNIYEHGGSRIFIDKDGDRELLADTYHTKEFAIAVRDFIARWLKQ